MKQLLMSIGLVTALTVFSSTTIARDQYKQNDRHRHEDNARVTHVEPIYSTIRVATPYQNCKKDHKYRNQYRDSRNYAPTILGGIIGGVIGNQFGQGKGKTVLTVTGTVLGGAIGHQLNYRSQTNTDYKHPRKCRARQQYHEEQRHDGYRVTYRYNGRSYTTKMDHRPGKYIPIAISVRPIGRFY